MILRIKRIEKDLPLPEYKTEGAVAFDFYSRINDIIPAKTTKIIPSNFIIEVPKGFALLIASRSSTPKKGLTLANGLGVLDQDYHGPEDEIGLFLYNFTENEIEIKRGDRLAQGLLVPIEKAVWEEAEEMKKESRGGFGSTG